MFNLYSYNASDFEAIDFSKITVVLFGQASDCSSFLVLSDEDLQAPFTKETDITSVNDRFDFVYRQEWGLTINNDIIRRVKKDLRMNDLLNLKVTYNDVSFDADEVSQGRMSRAILGLSDTDVIGWVSADNNFVQLNRLDFINILKLSGEAQTNLWLKYS